MCTSNMLQPDISVDVSLSHLFGKKKKHFGFVVVVQTHSTNQLLREQSLRLNTVEDLMVNQSIG